MGEVWFVVHSRVSTSRAQLHAEAWLRVKEVEHHNELGVELVRGLRVEEKEVVRKVEVGGEVGERGTKVEEGVGGGGARREAEVAHLWGWERRGAQNAPVPPCLKRPVEARGGEGAHDPGPREGWVGCMARHLCQYGRFDDRLAIVKKDPLPLGFREAGHTSRRGGEVRDREPALEGESLMCPCATWRGGLRDPPPVGKGRVIMKHTLPQEDGVADGLVPQGLPAQVGPAGTDLCAGEPRVQKVASAKQHHLAPAALHRVEAQRRQVGT